MPGLVALWFGCTHGTLEVPDAGGQPPTVVIPKPDGGDITQSDANGSPESGTASRGYADTSNDVGSTDAPDADEAPVVAEGSDTATDEDTGAVPDLGFDVEEPGEPEDPGAPAHTGIWTGSGSSSSSSCLLDLTIAAIRSDGSDCADVSCTSTDALGWSFRAYNGCSSTISTTMTCSSFVGGGDVSGGPTTVTFTGSGAGGGGVTIILPPGAGYGESTSPGLGVLGAGSYTITAFLCDPSRTLLSSSFTVVP